MSAIDHNEGNMREGIFQSLSQFKTPIFLALCVILGGTSQEIYNPKIILYLLSALIIGAHVFKYSLRALFSEAKFIFSLVGGLIIFSAMQLIPLSPSIWASLPGRDLYVQSFDLMQLPHPSLPLAMVPGAVLPSSLSVLPAVAIFLLITRTASKNERILSIWTVPVLAFLSLLFGVIQVVSQDKGLYLYKITNHGAPVGVFSNINHQANYLVIALVFSLTLAVSTRLTRSRETDPPSVGVIIACLLSMFFVIGLFFNGSSAGYALLVLAIVLTGLSFLNFQNRASIRWSFLIGLGLIILVAVDFFYLGTAQQNFLHSLSDDKSTSRRAVFKSTWEIIKSTLPYGTGLGSFRETYPNFEDVNAVTGIYLPHVHNDFLEFIMEMGIVGIVLIIGWFVWFLGALKNLLKSNSIAAQFGKMAAIALIIIAAHSLVDYPLRTLTISTVAGLCMGLVHVGQH